MTPEEILARLFDSDPADPKFYEINPPYVGDAEIGARPFWDPLCEVWACPNPYPVGTHRWQCWQDARALLDGLHAQYVKERR